jgi:hypothetical protein
MTISSRVVIGCLKLTFLLLLDSQLTSAQVYRVKNEHWDISVWCAGATGEENRDAFSEAQLWSGGIFVGRVLAAEVGKAWWKGSLEYGFTLIPVVVSSGAQHAYGGGFEPVVVRWNSNHSIRRLRPYIELAGGAVVSNANLPQGDTSSFNFAARGGGGIQISTKRRQSLDFGIRWWHLSNANLASVTLNSTGCR